MMDIPLVNLKAQYKTISKFVDEAVLNILSQGNFILGKDVSLFEEAFSKYCGVKYTVGVASGSAALLLGLRALDVKPGDEVIAPANTFISTVLPILELGATPVLVDIHPDTYQIDLDKIEKAITKKTKAILPVHLYGIPAPMEEINKIARKYNLLVFEDACQAHGSSINNKKCGSFGHAAAFSFYPGKNLGAAGDGGAITTSSKKLHQTLVAMRNIGQRKKYKHDIFGYNSRLDTIHAAVLNVKLKYLNGWNKKRRIAANLYIKSLSDLPIIMPPKMDKKYVVNYHIFVTRSKRRNKLLKYLNEHSIQAGIHYPIPIHLQKGVNKLIKHKKGDFPITEEYAKEILSLPIYPEITPEEIEYVSKLMHDFYRKGSENA